MAGALRRSCHRRAVCSTRADLRRVGHRPAGLPPPVVPRQNGKADAPVARTGSRRVGRRPGAPDIGALLAGVLFVFTLDFEAVARIALATAANTLRVLDTEGVRIRDLATRTGVSREANAMCRGWLQRHGCAEEAPDPNAPRGRVLRLTTKGRAAQAKYMRILGATEED